MSAMWAALWWLRWFLRGFLLLWRVRGQHALVGRELLIAAGQPQMRAAAKAQGALPRLEFQSEDRQNAPLELRLFRRTRAVSEHLLMPATGCGEALRFLKDRARCPPAFPAASRLPHIAARVRAGQRLHRQWRRLPQVTNRCAWRFGLAASRQYRIASKLRLQRAAGKPMPPAHRRTQVRQRIHYGNDLAQWASR